MSTLLQITDLQKSYSDRIILDEASFTIAKKQKIALIGRNGAGKSTLLRIIMEQEKADLGDVNFFPDTRVAYLTQHSDFQEDEEVMNYLIRKSQKPDFECARLASQFQLKNQDHKRRISDLAGGYQMRVKLTAMLLTEPNLLLLDEPTNYLDLSTQILLENFLQNYNGAFVLISHDREFLKRTCTETLELENGKLTLYPGDIDSYFDYKSGRLVQIEKHNQKIERERKHLQSFVDRFGAKASKASAAQSKIKQIEKLKTIDIETGQKTVKIKIPSVSEKKGIALEVEDLSIGYSSKIVAKKINLDIERGQKIVIVGDNGQGKSTFLKTIQGSLPPLAGQLKWGHGISIGYFSQHSAHEIPKNLSVHDYLKSVAPSGTDPQEILSIAGSFLFYDSDLKKEITVLSGGECSRLALAGILLQKHHVILLDEPTNHLDFETTEALALGLSESTSTIIVVSHNRSFVDTIANGIIEVKNGQVKRYHHNYEEYVYHLKKELTETDNTQEKSEKSPKTTSKNNYQQTKELNKELRKLEKEIQKLEQENKKILQWFEDNPGEFSAEKQSRLNALATEISDAEERWLELELEIEVLNS